MSTYRPHPLERALELVTDSAGKLLVLTVTVIVVRLMAISGYDTQTALALAGGSDLFALTFSLFVSAFSTIVSLVVSVLLLAVSQRIADHAPVPVILTSCATGGLVIMLLTAPLSALSWLPLVLGVAALLTSLPRRRWSGSVMRTFFSAVWGLAIVGVCALLGQALLFNSAPFGHPHVLRVQTKFESTSVTGSIVGYPLGVTQDQIGILEYQPRQVIILPAAAIQLDQICSLPEDSIARPSTAAAWVARAVSRKRQVYVPLANSPSCFDWPTPTR